MKNVLPGDLKLKEFGKRFRGLDADEVRSFLVEVAGYWENAERRREDFERRVAELETALKDFRSRESAIEQTLVEARQTTGIAIDSARKEAQLIIQEAESKAAGILEKARTDLTAMQEQVVILRAKKESIVARMRMLLKSELETLDALDIDEQFQQSDSGMQQETSETKSEIDEIIRSLDEHSS